MTLTDPMRIASGVDPLAAQAQTLIGQARRVLELGTLRSDPTFPTHHQAWAPEAHYVKADVEAGLDVDVVVDAHNLQVFPDGDFDAVVAVAIWEHLARPWIATNEAARVLAPGGVLYVSTHHTFPLHGYPNDYWRFSTEALAVLFADAGLEVIDVGYQYPAKIVPPAEVTRWNPDAEAWLNVSGLARKPGRHLR